MYDIYFVNSFLDFFEDFVLFLLAATNCFHMWFNIMVQIIGSGSHLNLLVQGRVWQTSESVTCSTPKNNCRREVDCLRIEWCLIKVIILKLFPVSHCICW